ncbi:FAD-binding domain-containing protein [Pseudoalteromonas sp. YIC-656]|uniref:FAD-binding domain-containing protein n=1 Tax=Pseudoalteromonas pernae TaxID=3118054 RepID=UPI003242F8CF
MINLVWLKRDFRLDDHAPLHFAALNGKPTLVVYVIEPHYWQLEDTSMRQFTFIAQALRSLATELEKIGAFLLVRSGDVCDVLSRIHQHAPIDTLFNHQETGNSWTFARDQQVFAWCKQHGITVNTYRQQAVFRGKIDRDTWHAKANDWLEQSCYPAPQKLLSLITHHDGLALLDNYVGDDELEAISAQRGSHTAAINTRNSFFTQRIRHYRYGISSIIKSGTACSRLSPYLAYGLVSLRDTMQRLYALPSCDGNRDAVLSRLHWHSHFVQKLESEPRYCEQAVHQDLVTLRENEFDPMQFQRWCQGQTGVPFVDACMRYLHHHGWLNFRMRAMLIAYASYQLWLDWHQPAAFLAQQFVDYEPGIHYPQVQMQSGTTGINPWRMYNPVTQGQKYDAQGHFIRKWLPELDHVPSAYIHTPWLYTKLKTDSYDRPSFPPDVALRQAKEKISAFYKAHVNRSETQRIITTHASRKRQKKKVSSNKNTKQLNLF